MRPEPAAEAESGVVEMAAAMERGPAGPARRWTVALDEDTHADVTLLSGWLTWTTDIDPSRAGIGDHAADASRAKWSVLQQHPRWPLSLTCVDLTPGMARLRCDWPVAGDADVVRRCDELRQASLWALGVSRGGAIARGPAPSPGDLLALCREAEWPAEEGPRGVRVRGSVVRGAFDAVVSTDDSGGVEVAIDAVSVSAQLDASTVPAPLATVVSGLLFSVAARRHFARPFVRADAGGTAIGFGVSLGGAPSAEELAHALGALAAAHDECGPELIALVTTDLADRLARERQL